MQFLVFCAAIGIYVIIQSQSQRAEMRFSVVRVVSDAGVPISWVITNIIKKIYIDLYKTLPLLPPGLPALRK
jgi:hypothetical protein